MAECGIRMLDIPDGLIERLTEEFQARIDNVGLEVTPIGPQDRNGASWLSSYGSSVSNHEKRFNVGNISMVMESCFIRIKSDHTRVRIGGPELCPLFTGTQLHVPPWGIWFGLRDGLYKMNMYYGVADDSKGLGPSFMADIACHGLDRGWQHPFDRPFRQT